MRASRLITLGAGMLILGYVVVAIVSGRVLVTWGRTVDRSSVLYWVVVVALTVLAGANLMVSLSGRN